VAPEQEITLSNNLLGLGRGVAKTTLIPRHKRAGTLSRAMRIARKSSYFSSHRRKFDLFYKSHFDLLFTLHLRGINLPPGAHPRVTVSSLPRSPLPRSLKTRLLPHESVHRYLLRLQLAPHALFIPTSRLWDLSARSMPSTFDPARDLSPRTHSPRNAGGHKPP